MSRNRPSSMRSVFADLAVFCTDDQQTNMDRAVHVAGVIDTVKTASARYKAAVLAHPDLAERLRRALFLTRAEQWTGFIPPREDSDGKPCSSPYRATVVAIVTEALKRDDSWDHGDDQRLYAVPERFIKAAWKESLYEHRQKEAQARLAALVTEDEGDD